MLRFLNVQLRDGPLPRTYRLATGESLPTSQIFLIMPKIDKQSSTPSYAPPNRQKRTDSHPECPHCHSRMGSIVIETKPWRKVRQRIRQCLFCKKEFESEELYFVRSEEVNNGIL
jgi:hypothetical protein